MNCSKCGNTNPGSGRFCTGCGAALSEARPGQDYAATVLSGAPAAIQADPFIGHVIDGKYRIDTKLGSGGMGTVYRVTRLLIGDSVAVKLLHADQVADSQAVERFRREAQAAARLKHPNAVTIYDFGVSEDGMVYLVMELVEGRNLREIIKQQGPITPTASVEIINQVCAALDEAHRHNIVHRDVKPDNIIVSTTPSGLNVKVLDFGIAKLRDLATTASSLTQTGSVVGTPHYMSPEQCLGEELDHRSDIYSLGIVLYESLTGIAPFNSPTSAAVVVQHVTQPPPPLRSLNLTISPAVEAVVLRALEKRREARPQTAGSLAQELSAAVQGGVSPPISRADLQPVPMMPTAGGAAPAPTMQMPIAPRSSGSVTPAGMPAFSSGAQWAGATESAASTKAKRYIPIIIVGIALAVIAAGLVIYLNLSSAKKSILSEIKKGNLVKPEGNSAYDLYLKNTANLNANEKTEITNEVLPLLEKRGEEILALQKQPAYESEPEMAEAIRLYSWLNELRPKAAYESRKFFSEGRFAFSRKDYNKAMSAYKRAIELDSSWALPINGMGRTYVNVNDYYNAKQYYTRATEVDPRWISPWMNLGALSFSKNDYYVAEDSMNHALEIDPEKASAHYLLAQVYEKTERWCDAVREYNLALNNVHNQSSPGFNVETARSKSERLKAKYYCY